MHGVGLEGFSDPVFSLVGLAGFKDRASQYYLVDLVICSCLIGVTYYFVSFFLLCMGPSYGVHSLD